MQVKFKIKTVGFRSINFFHRPIPMNGKLGITLETDACKGSPNYVRYLEHVQARITLTADRRGEIEIYLTSPSSTKSTLLARRGRDYSREGFNNWAFMTTHNWGEEAEGKWYLQIENGASSCEFYDQICVFIFRTYYSFFFQFLFIVRLKKSRYFHFFYCFGLLWHEVHTTSFCY